MTLFKRNRFIRYTILLVFLVLIGAGAWNLASAFIADRSAEPQRSRLLAAMQSPEVRELRARGIPGGGTRLSGTLSGRRFSVMVPRSWNRQIIVVVHGYTFPGTPVDPPDKLSELDPAKSHTAFYEQGYAIAFSAYDKSGYAVESGAKNSARLRDVLIARLHPDKTYALGISMGGTIALAMLEQIPNHFDGALATCGVVDGWEAEMQRVIDVRATYEYFTRNTPYRLPGNPSIEHSALSSDPSGLWRLAPSLFQMKLLRQILKPVSALFIAAKKNPGGPEDRIVQAIASVNRIDAEPSSFLFPLAILALGMDDLTQSMGGTPYGNRDKVYYSSLLSVEENFALNRGIQRIDVSPAAVAYARIWHQASGTFSVPLVTLHNRVDPLVPYAQTTSLAAIVDAKHNSGNLLQITVPQLSTPLLNTGLSGLAHCGFSHDQLVGAFHSLTEWVETGVKPSNLGVEASQEHSGSFVR